MYSVCYVLVDTTNFTYTNEILVSIKSLRKYWTDNVIVAVDKNTRELILKSKYEDVFAEFDVNFLIIPVDDTFSNMKKSRYIKTSLRNHVKGNYLYIDTDTIVVAPLGDIDIGCGFIAMVYDMHLNFDAEDYKFNWSMKEAQRCQELFCEKIGYKDQNARFYNSGIIFCKDVPESYAFYEKWNAEWLKFSDKDGIFLDQPSLNYVNYLMNHCITSLDDQYNVQVSVGFSYKYVESAVIIHYFNCAEGYLFSKKRPPIYGSDVADWVIEHPKDAFIDDISSISDSVMGYVFEFSKRHPRVYRFVNDWLYRLHTLKSKYKRKKDVS